MRMKNLVASIATGSVLALALHSAHAAVTPEEAAALKTTLTPFGAERAGNKEGTIPAWEGGYTKSDPGYKSGDARVDLFPGEKPKFSINAKNLDQHADKLSEGIKALLKKYPDSFRLDVYPTHRTAAAPQWVYDNTYKNATRAKIKEDGVGLEGAYGGIPFPIPKSGIEAMWNHKLFYYGEYNGMNVSGFIGTADGKVIHSSRARNIIHMPYYDKNGSLEKFNGEYQLMRIFVDGPPHKSGEQFFLIDSLNKPRQAWQYLVGQRRVRKAPTICCDAPEEVNSGVDYWDEAYGFWGDLDLYDWKLAGKKEIYIPYNSNKFFEKKNTRDKQVLPHHLNPDLVRWELHRVWVVDATLKKGKRHVVPKRRFYLDEDTWGAVLSEGWDAQGQLWRLQMTQPLVVPEGPFVYPTVQWTVFNLLAGNYLGSCVNDWGDPTYTYHFKVYDRISPAEFTPDALAGQGVR
ncbi:MAG TPA: DUF1329 domain-containing protein [Candidatus Desulfobacillus sp.]|nr:DUF1329 domain-containing protein [Candidatus Desulfobacillus sp.]